MIPQGLTVLIKDVPHHSTALGDSLALFSVMGKPLLLYNIGKLASRKSIDYVLIPEGFTHAASVISASYPSLRIDEYKDRTLIPTDDLFELQFNSIIVDSEMGGVVADQIVYPWDLLRIMNKVLVSEVKDDIDFSKCYHLRVVNSQWPMHH